MFEQYIEDQKKRLHNSVVSGAKSRNGFTSAVLLSESSFICDAYRHYFAAETVRRVREIRSELLKNPHFLISEPDGKFIEQFEETLQNTAIFSDEELVQIIDDAVKTRLNFLCRPRTALKCFIFDEKETLNTQEIYVRLNYFFDYDYLIEGVRRKIDKRDCTADKILHKEEFMQAVERVDNDYIFDLTPRQFVDILAPLFDFFSPDTSLGVEKSIPTEALVVFLDDKHIEPIAQELERLYYDENCTEITESIFFKIVTDILDTIDESESENNAENNAEISLETDTEIVKNTDTKNQNIVASGEFITSPGEFAAVLALKEFIDPEFIEKEKSIKFTVKFAPKSVEPLPEASDALNAASASLGELKASLTELENTAKEAGEILDKVVETIGEIDEQLSDGENTFTSDVNIADEKFNEKFNEKFHSPAGSERFGEADTTENIPVSDDDVYAENIAENNKNELSGDANKNYYSEGVPCCDETKAEDNALFFAEDIDVESNDENNVENYDNIAAENIDADEVIALVLESENMADESEKKNEEAPKSYAIIRDELIKENDSSAAILTSTDEIKIAEIVQTDGFDTAQAESFPKISEILGDKRERYIKKLFNKDEAVFQKLSDEINASRSWKIAAQIYDNFLIDCDIPLDNSLAVEFRNMIKSRYAV